MNRDEMIEEIKKKEECHLVEMVKDLISRTITQDEKILGRYLKTEEVEVKKTGVPTVKYNYYIVTNRTFVRIFASDTEYWDKVCPLNRFMGVEEKNLSLRKLQVKIYFDVIDEDLRHITLTSEKDDENTKIKKFVSALTEAVSALHKE